MSGNELNFDDWLDCNPAIWKAFRIKADAIRNTGRETYSARTIIESIRWETDLRDKTDATFKINNNRVPGMARLYNHVCGEDFFKLREQE